MKIHKSAFETGMDNVEPGTNYKCTFDDCEKVYRLQSNLEAHMRIHDGSKVSRFSFWPSLGLFNQLLIFRPPFVVSAMNHSSEYAV
jgi:Zinc finger, C2H2 type